MRMTDLHCPTCKHTGIDKGRTESGRRAYRCQKCDTEWPIIINEREPRYSPQRQEYQFHDTGAWSRAKQARWERTIDDMIASIGGGKR
jgi:transposase-like protein